MTLRSVIRFGLLVASAVFLLNAAVATSVTTLIGTGSPGYSDEQIHTPLGLAMGPDGALYFCDYGNQRIRRLDLKTKRLTTVAGNGETAYKGDGGQAIHASLRAPHELRFDPKGDLYIAEKDSQVIRKIHMKTGIITTVAGTGTPGFSGDGGPGTKAQLHDPQGIFFDKDGSLLICDVGNHRIRRLNLDTGFIETYAGTGEAKPTPEGAPVQGTPLNGPRTIAAASNGDLYVVLRDGNSIYRIDAHDQTLHHVAATGEIGYSGDGGPALLATFGKYSATGAMVRPPGPKGLAYGDGILYVADTESNAIRGIDLRTGLIKTVLGTGEPGDGAEHDPTRCRVSRPHAIMFAEGALYVADSDTHRIRVVR